MFLGDIFSQKDLVPFGDEFSKKKRLILSGVANKTAKSFIFSKLFKKSKNNFLWVVNNKNDIVEVSETLNLFLDNKKWDIKSFEIGNDIQKIEYLISLDKKLNKNQIFILNQNELKRMFFDLDSLNKEKITIYKGDKINLLQFFNNLIESNYEISQDVILQKGQHRRSGDVIDIFPLGHDYPVKIEIEFDRIKNIYEFFPESKKMGKSLDEIDIFPCSTEISNKHFFEFFKKEDVLIFDDIEDIDFFEQKLDKSHSAILDFTSFIEHEKEGHYYLRYLSVLKFFNLFDLIADIREKLTLSWRIIILSKRKEEMEKIFLEEKIPFSEEKVDGSVLFLDAKDLEHIPASFQNQEEKILFLTDREVFQIRKQRKMKAMEGVNMSFLSSLKVGDFVVHANHGIGRFLGIAEQEIDGIKREFLEIGYADNDKLFTPIDQADKVASFVADDNTEPRITRLGSREWANICRNVKKETEKIAKELLKVQAMRAKAKGYKFLEDNKDQREFEKTFPYEETPGQIKAIMDTKGDMENGKPMDRLICGDVGFGKTEVAMRAAFKAVQSNKQVAIVAPITILADQHYKSFKKRMDDFGINIEMLSRFRSPAEQKKIVKDLAKGKIDIIIGTHRLLQDDIKFLDLGLVVVDEEQRFGVKQKEKFKTMRKEVDILTMSATPIPRTLNLALHKLRDITTITTPPPGRLPVITEVRKYSDNLVKEAILKEVERGGQVFFLYNRVQTIEAIAQKLRHLVPEAKFVVAHGQMKPDELEEKIVAFKNKEYDVLVSSTIIENGIDLPNANTLIVRNAEQFGLSQLYQLRGRIGRGRTQAHAYFLYQTQKLRPEAKKRLRAIVEASELGSGFQIAMKDLEIRGAGDVLGVNQHGTVNTVGVHHFLRLLNQTIKEIKMGSGKSKNISDVLIEIPIDAYIPGSFIADQKEKILVYQQLSAVKNFEALDELARDLEEEFGTLPRQLRNLFRILRLKLHATEAGLKAIRSIAVGKNGREIQVHLSKEITAVEIMNLLKYNEKWQISGDKLKINVKELGFDWVGELMKSVERLKKKKK